MSDILRTELELFGMMPIEIIDGAPLLASRGYFTFQMDAGVLSDDGVLYDIERKLEVPFGAPIQHYRHSQKALGTSAVIIAADTSLYDSTRRPQSSPERQSLHMDGAYEATVPEVVVLFCLSPACDGGVSLIGDSKNAFERMAELFPSEVPCLFSNDCYAVIRGARASVGPVFTIVAESPDHVEIACRFSDHEFNRVEVRQDCQTAFRRFKSIIDSEEICHEIPLRAGQGLVVINQRVLHGRTAWVDNAAVKRRVARYWFSGGTPFLKGIPSGFRIKKSDNTINLLQELERMRSI
jgi:alpha-ketoglutarate-dependent taurine dioxygenase